MDRALQHNIEKREKAEHFLGAMIATLSADSEEGRMHQELINFNGVFTYALRLSDLRLHMPRAEGDDPVLASVTGRASLEEYALEVECDMTNTPVISETEGLVNIVSTHHKISRVSGIWSIPQGRRCYIVRKGRVSADYRNDLLMRLYKFQAEDNLVLEPYAETAFAALFSGIDRYTESVLSKVREIE